MTVDPEQRLFRLVGGGSGVLYGVRADGALQWFRHTDPAGGSAAWANGGSAKVIGSGWHDFVEVLGNTDGSLFGVYGDGRVMRYRYVVTDSATGAGNWENNGAGVQVGSGWNRFPRIFGGPENALWGVDAQGDLWRSQLTGGVLPEPVKVGSGFQDTTWLGADTGGTIYGVRFGALCWWRYLGNGAWANGGNLTQIGDTAWGALSGKSITAGGGGLIYVVRPDNDLTTPGHDGNLVWLRLSNWLTANLGADWANGGNGRVIGSGFTIERGSPLQGYAVPMSVTPGSPVGIAASTTHPSLQLSVVRHAPGTEPVEVQAAQMITGRLQTLPAGYMSTGCGWGNLAAVAVGPDWPSGLYSARLEGPHGKYKHIPFVVRPVAPTAPLAVILPTFTYGGYSMWGGHSAYFNVPAGKALPLSTRRPSSVMHVEPTGRLDCELYSDLLLLRWLSANGYRYDLYTDEDLAATPGLLGGYRAVALGTHPEYVTAGMRQVLADYSTTGGRLLYCGGNGLYEQVDACGATVTYRNADGSRRVWQWAGDPESRIVGVKYVDVGWNTFAPYKVVSDHPILAGTGLTAGSTFGASGYNHGASGIEMDHIDTSYAPGAVVIAVGQNAAGGGHLTWWDRGNGGWVFAAGSLTFAGALGHDPALDQLMRNVMDRAVA